MFEKAQPQPISTEARFVRDDALGGDLVVDRSVVRGESNERGGAALRMMEWGELTARLNAARDLRLVLRRDAHGNIGANGGSFADAAARYFRAREEDQPDVNPVALEHRKGSSGIASKAKGSPSQAVQDRGYAATGDARENK